MNYPHWFCYLVANDFTLTPCAVMLISEEQARDAIHRYVNKKGGLWASDTTVSKYNSLDELLHDTGLAKEDLIVLSDDDRGKCIAFTYCDEPGGRCGVDYYDGGCFV